MKTAKTIRISISDRTMVANAFDGGGFERLFPGAKPVPSKRSNVFDVDVETAQNILYHVEMCPAHQGAAHYGEGTRESYAETSAVRATSKQIRAKLAQAEELERRGVSQ